MSFDKRSCETWDEESVDGATMTGVGRECRALNRHGERDRAAHRIVSTRDLSSSFIKSRPMERGVAMSGHDERDRAALYLEPEAQPHKAPDEAIGRTSATRDIKPEAQPKKPPASHSRHGERHRATWVPDPEAQPHEALASWAWHGKRDEAVRRTSATRDIKPEAQPLSGDNNEQRFPDDAVNIIEAGVRAAIPRRYCSGTSESERSSAQPPTIYTVPRQLAMGNPRAYTPMAVHIGFIGLADGSRSETPEKMEAYKTCCVRRLITCRHQAAGHPAAWTPAERQLLHECLDTLKRLAPRIRAAHDGITPTHFESDELIATQSLRDGCFVLHRLLKYAHIARRAEQGNGGEEEEEEDDDDDWMVVFGECWVWGYVTYDLLLLQNQIPFFVLQALFELLKSNPDERDDVLITGALQLFRSLHPHGHEQHSSPIACRDVHHLLHLFYLSISFPTPTPGDVGASNRRHVLPSELPLWVPCATELKEAGVRLRVRKSGAVSFLDVRFHGGVLEIPPLRLYDYSESIFRNLIAFEQTYPATPGHITAYAIFMACLVTTHQDMRLLQQSGILLNEMSSGERDAATRFFSGISAQAHTSADLNYLAGMMEEVVRYQSGRWPRWRASLVRNYLSNPWVITSAAAAVFLLCLTVVQAFFAAYAYFKPPAS